MILMEFSTSFLEAKEQFYKAVDKEVQEQLLNLKSDIIELYPKAVGVEFTVDCDGHPEFFIFHSEYGYDSVPPTTASFFFELGSIAQMLNEVGVSHKEIRL
jgi:hypothetical protein